MKLLPKIAMASVKKALVPRPPRSKSTSSRPSHPQTRTLRTNANRPLQQSNSDAALSSKLKNLTLKDGPPPNEGQSRGSRVRTVTSANKTRHFSSGSSSISSLEDVARLIKQQQVKRVIVMAGAGISTSSGIPDFRTPGTGLYDNLKQYKIPYPEAIFDIDYFIYTPKPFFTLAKELYPSGKYKPNYVHYFVRMLHEKGVLLRMYTQNIDGLERLAGIPASKLVEAHGTFATATCVRCRTQVPGDSIRADVFADKLPRCRTARCNGIVKPDIVFFGEDLPKRFYFYMKDFPQADLLIVMGTSLEVEPFAGIVDSVRYSTPRLLVNWDAVGPFVKSKRTKDAVATGDLVDNIKKFSSLLGWTEEMNDIMSKNESILVEMMKNPEKFAQTFFSSDKGSNAVKTPRTNLNRPKREFHTFSAKSEPNLPRPPAGSVRNNSNNNGVKFPAIKDSGNKKKFSTIHWKKENESDSDDSSSEEESSSGDDQ